MSEGVFTSHSIPQETPIQIPSNEDLPDFVLPLKPATFIPGLSQPTYIPRTQGLGSNDYMTPGETEEALKDLISGNINDVEVTEIDPEDKIVDGFKSGIQLLDHQVVGRKWMAGRECPAEKKYGGILADDMG